MMDTPNRAQRRAAARGAKGRSKPRSQHRRTVVTNPITYAQEGANLVPQHKRDAITSAMRAALRAVRTGTATYAQWEGLQSDVNKLKSINVKTDLAGMDSYLHRAQLALDAIYTRASGGDPNVDTAPARWVNFSCRAQELDDLNVILTLQRAAFDVCSVRQWEVALQHAMAMAATNISTPKKEKESTCSTD